MLDQARFACGEGFYDLVMELPLDEFPRRNALIALVERRFRDDPELATRTIRFVDPLGERWVSDTIEVGYQPKSFMSMSGE